MTTEIPKNYRDMTTRARTIIAQRDLCEPVTELLTTLGPLGAGELEYFLLRRHDIRVLGGSTMGEAARDLVRLGHIKVRQPTKGNYDSIYYMPGDMQRAPAVPVYKEGYEDLKDAFIELYLRYQAIRNNPSLATAPESLIDDLYNPSHQQA